ncbi:hypothetical protein LEP1GSC133_0159 [Leptospira borgpetersenii serovar Pomona str. 200901868]|uniref:Uncharacterized protein n=1 Tax=Leptospira borgpetersenii serovar Pomona str. 200901868 TaxID=1192866 RepID=M6VRW1_LEPBO|nr:hypothetical protein LEP1GSC133_0159 [Leptospira borgpetersenii serovar Pomona str. 200901868]
MNPLLEGRAKTLTDFQKKARKESSIFSDSQKSRKFSS